MRFDTLKLLTRARKAMNFKIGSDLFKKNSAPTDHNRETDSVEAPKNVDLVTYSTNICSQCKQTR